jgi:hypothetical protein
MDQPNRDTKDSDSSDKKQKRVAPAGAQPVSARCPARGQQSGLANLAEVYGA